MPPYATGSKALNMDLKYANAFDGNFNTRWSIGSTNAPAQTIGDQFTFDMVAPHAFKKVLFWAGGENGVNGPDPRDYPGALDLATSNDCVTFGPAIASGNEPQPGCGGATACSMPFVITLPAPATARCVRLTLTKRLQVGGPIWWAIAELFVYP
ncbi:MAG TPA: discoidin domain-containing protein [Polyangia bacterium]